MPAPPNLPGGQLYMEYRHTPSGERHTLRIHLAYFDPAPIGEINNRAYTSDGPVVPTDATIVDSYNSFAVLWQQYYNADWELRCVALLRYDSFTEVVLTPTPDYPVHNGTDTTETSDKLYFERKYKLLSKTGSRRELVLAQVIDTTLRPHAFYVGASSGGVDARDQALMAYFSGASGTGFVMPDGNYAFSDTEMSVWWNKQPEATDHPGVIVDNCLVFPEGAALCNPSTDVVTLHTPMGDFTYDATGLTLPGGWRIDNDAQFIGLADTPDDRLFVIRRPDGRGMITVAQSGVFFDLGLSGEPDFITRNLRLENGEWKLSGSTFAFLTDLEPAGTGFDGGDINQGAHAELELPFGNATTAPLDLLVKDPTSGVPRYYPEGRIGVIKPVEDAPIPTGTPTDQSRCGAAFSMAHELWTCFNRLTSIARSLIAIGTGFSGPTVAEAIICVFLGPEAVVAEWVMFALTQAVKQTIDAAIADTIGALDGPQEDALANALYCHLTEVSGVVQVTQTTIDNWRAAVPSYVTATVGQLDILNLLIPAWTLEAWRRYAYLGAANPSTNCGGFTCL